MMIMRMKRREQLVHSKPDEVTGITKLFLETVTDTQGEEKWQHLLRLLLTLLLFLFLLLLLLLHKKSNQIIAQSIRLLTFTLRRSGEGSKASRERERREREENQGRHVSSPRD